jgi:hypothetical protein
MLPKAVTKIKTIYAGDTMQFHLRFQLFRQVVVRSDLPFWNLSVNGSRIQL